MPKTPPFKVHAPFATLGVRACGDRVRAGLGLAAAGEIVEEQVFAAGKGIAGLPQLQAEGIRVKDVQARLRFQRADLVQELALDQQAEAAQVIDFQPLAQFSSCHARAKASIGATST